MPTPSELFQLDTLFNAGNYIEMERWAQSLSERFPACGAAWKALGFALQVQGKNSLVANQKAAELLPDDAVAHYNRGIDLFSMGRLEDAAASYRNALKIKPDIAQAHYNLGNILSDLGQVDEAELSYRGALSFNPGYVEAYTNLGNLLKQKNQLAEAEAAYRRALELKPDYIEALNNLANLLNEANSQVEAEEMYCRVLVLRPDYVVAHNNLGNLFKDSKRVVEAEAAYLRAIALKPDYVDAHNNLGNLLKEMDRPTEAEAAYCRAIELKPDYVEASNNLGVLFRETNRLKQAEAAFLRTIELKPDFAGSYSNLGILYVDQGRRDEAEIKFRQALAAKPEFAEVRWMLAMIQIPLVADSIEAVSSSREKFVHELAGLNTWFDAARSENGYMAVGTYQPFYLAYQEQNNRELLSQYGTLCCRLMKRWQDRQVFPSSPRIAGGEVIRLGIVSSHLYRHSVWDAIVKGWFQHLDRTRIELHVFCLGSEHDEETAWAKSQSASFEQGKRSLLQWVEAIHEKQVDALIYPEIGMDLMTAKLASLRLAPIQIAAWGHPETTGLPTMDYYLSAEYLEADGHGKCVASDDETCHDRFPHPNPLPEGEGANESLREFHIKGAQSNYSEKLICLPNLGCYYQPAQGNITVPDFSNLGIDNTVPVLLCPGVPFKYAPQYDHVLVKIASRLGKCQLVFFTHKIEAMSEKLRQRLEAAFANAGMNFNDFGVFIPWQKKSAFYGLMQQADVFLDTLGFSGFNTATQAVECGLPIVTKEGRFMRGRLASAILRRMGITELIAGTDEEYVNLAVNLAQNSEYRSEIRQRIEKARDVLFHDMAAVRALEDFLINIVPK